VKEIKKLLPFVKIDPVNEKHTVQVVQLMLNDAGKETFYFQLHRLPAAVQGAKANDFSAGDFS
jgi:hypothetical protein